jgi:predicted DNA-binding protein (UPF0251 family)
MNTKRLEQEYKIASETKSFAANRKFVASLLAETGEDAALFHFNLLQQIDNKELYQDTKAAYKKRGNDGEVVLLKVLESNPPPQVMGDALQLLGGIRSSHAISWARKCIVSEDNELRYKAIIVIGWVGVVEDIEILKRLLINDSRIDNRGYAATAMRQIFLRLPESQPQILKALLESIKSETSEEVIKLVIVTAQTILNQKLGLRESISQNTITGNVSKARAKTAEALFLSVNE